MDIATSNLDLRCFRCGYSLEGVQADAVCPECGLAITRSIEGSRFVFCPLQPRQIVRLLRVIAASDLLGLFLLVTACGWAIGGVGGNPFAILHLALVGAASVARSLMVLLLRRQSRSCWQGGEPEHSVVLSYPAGVRIATAVMTVGLVATGAHIGVCVGAALLWGVFGGIEAGARLAWMRAVGRALGGQAAKGLNVLTFAALISLLLGAALGSVCVLGFWSMLIILLLPLPIVLLALLGFEFAMFGATIAAADVVSEWHAARVEP